MIGCNGLNLGLAHFKLRLEVVGSLGLVFIIAILWEDVGTRPGCSDVLVDDYPRLLLLLEAQHRGTMV